MKKKFIVSCLILLACTVIILVSLNVETIKNYFFTKSLTNFVKENSQDTNHVSVYLYMFNSKQEIMINNDHKYMPASLMKITCMIAYYKQAETNPKVLQQTLVYQPEALDPLPQNILPEKKLEPGKAYTVDELINRMIIYSDNSASNMLFENLSNEALMKTFSDAGLAKPDFENVTYTVSASDFAKFFTELHNASYLNKAMSEKALDLLKRSEYKDGIVAGVPNSIPVAHKFAERRMRDKEIVNQFHECGIVYYTKNPYLLCVMTDGNNIFEQAKLAKNISHFVYEDIMQQKGLLLLLDGN